MHDIEIARAQYTQALRKIRAQVLILCKDVEDSIVNHSVSCRAEMFPEGTQGIVTEPQARQNTVQRDVYLHLALAASRGLTSSQILQLLEAERDVSWSAVRQALNRMRKSGDIRREGRSWYVI